VSPAARVIAAVHDATESTWESKLRGDVDEPDRELVVALVDDAVVGYTRLARIGEADPDGWWLVGLIVAPEARRLGVGEALVRAAVGEARRHADVLYSCYHRDNRASADLHRRVGFVVLRDGDTRFPGFEPQNPQVTVGVQLR
jgi:GNAT superfamily N-acetyltransferase